MKRLKQKYRYSYVLLKQLVKTDFKLRYQGSVLGYIWSLLRPFLLFITLYFVFTVFLRVGKGVPHYPVYLLVGIVIWNYFVEVTAGSVAAIVSKGDLIRKINFPKYIIIFAGSASALINLLLNAVVIAVFMYFNHIGLHLNDLLIIPLIFELFIMSMAIAFLLSSLYVKFRDVGYIWEVVLQAAFYATPILYPVSVISSTHLRIAKILMLNPMAQVIQDIRYFLVTPSATTLYNLFNNYYIWAIPIGLVIIVFVVSAIYFRKRSRYFAEEA